MKREHHNDPLPVVIINGLGAPHLAARMYGLMVAREGFSVTTLAPSLLGGGDIRAAAREVGRHIEQVKREQGTSQVNLVGMSLGGLIGLYYLKCLGGAKNVARFVSIGGPLNGAQIAYLSAVPPLSWVPAVRQSRPDSDLIDELRQAPAPDEVAMFSVGTRGDIITPPASRNTNGIVEIDAPVGVFPIGHWCLFLAPQNIRAVADLLKSP
ncbi:MAG: hypothetical protein JW797_19025 [Bradymonadales bacterium]|nr:hypothetical protein [Bradymonadales bacterium]